MTSIAIAAGVGFVGASDGLTDLQDGKLDWTYASTGETAGNTLMTGALPTLRIRLREQLLGDLLLIDDLSRHRIDHLDGLAHSPSFRSGQTRSTVNQTVPASAAEQANAFLSAAGQRKQARRSGPSARGL